MEATDQIRPQKLHQLVETFGTIDTVAPTVQTLDVGVIAGSTVLEKGKELSMPVSPRHSHRYLAAKPVPSDGELLDVSRRSTRAHLGFLVPNDFGAVGNSA